jgi:hypothetical protein
MSRSEHPEQIRAWAAARLSELDQERTALLQLFPGLGGRGSSAERIRPAKGRRSAESSGPTRRRRRRMSAAARKAVSQRMTQYWAERRKAKSAKAAKTARG